MSASGGESSFALGAEDGAKLVGSASSDVGSRPRPLPRGQAPAFRPDAPCRDQPLVDLKARTDGAVTPARRTTSRRTRTPRLTSQAQLRRLLARAEKEVRRR